MEDVSLGEVESGVLAGDVAVVGGVVVEQRAQPHSGMGCGLVGILLLLIIMILDIGLLDNIWQL